ncbi:MAG: hypothetical protein CMF52_04110, partial [Legionellales bacterium]|nr:hypothetical protein [Legionellales bacterium]
MADRSGARDKNKLAKQYAKGLKELCKEGTAQYTELGAFDLLPSDFRKTLKKNGDLRKAFADTAKSLFVPGGKGPDELLIDFVIDNIPNASSTDVGTITLMRELLQAEIHSHVVAMVDKGSVIPTLPFLDACISAIEGKLDGKKEPELVGPLHKVYHHEINERARKGIYFDNKEASKEELDKMFIHFEKLDALRARLDLAQNETLFKTQLDDGSFSSKDKFHRPLQSEEMKDALAKLRAQLNKAIQHFDKQRKLIASNKEGVEAKEGVETNDLVSEEAAAFLQSSLNDILPEKYVVNNYWVSTPQGNFIIEDVLGQIDPRIVRHGREEGQVAVYGGVEDQVDIAPLLKGQSAEAFRDDYEKSVFDWTIQECLSVHNGNKYFSCGDMHHDVGRVYDILTLKAKAVSEHEAFSELVKDDLEAFTVKLKSMCDKEIADNDDIEDLQKLDELLDAMHDYKVPEQSSRGRSQDIQRGKSELELRNLKDLYRELKVKVMRTGYKAKSDTEKQFDALEAKFIGRARGDKDKEYLKEL